MNAPRRPIYLTVEQAQAAVPGRSLRWVYDHMRMAGGRNGLVSDAAWWARPKRRSDMERSEGR